MIRTRFLCCLVALLYVTIASLPGLGRSAAGAAETAEAPPATLQNATQDARAERLAEMATARKQAAVDAAQAELDTAQDALVKARVIGDPKVVAEAEARVAEAQKTLDAATAGNTPVSAADVAAMRASGLGWGQIAQDLGLHPGALGQGHDKTRAKAQAGSADDDPTVTTGAAKKSGDGSGAAQGRGNGGGHGNGGGNGGGHGGGKNK